MDISPMDLQKCLSGIKYPASRTELTDRARDNGAGDDVTRALDAIADRQYEGPDEVTHAVARAT